MSFTGVDGADIQAEGGFGVNGKDAVGQATAYTQTYSTADRTVPTATQLTPPAGGTGADVGGWNNATDRNLAIASVTAGAADLLELKKVVTALIDDLQAVGLVG